MKLLHPQIFASCHIRDMACLAFRSADKLADAYRTEKGISKRGSLREARLRALEEGNVLTLTRRSLHRSHALSVVPS